MGKKGKKNQDFDDENVVQANDPTKGFVSYKQQVAKEKAEAHKGLDAFKKFAEEDSSEDDKPIKKKVAKNNDQEFTEEVAVTDIKEDQADLEVKKSKKKKNQNMQQANLLAAFENEEDEQDVGPKRKHKKKQQQQESDDEKEKTQHKKKKEKAKEVVEENEEPEEQPAKKEKKDKHKNKKEKEKKPKEAKEESDGGHAQDEEEEKETHVEEEEKEGYPLHVVYCQVCSLPPEYCAFGPSDLTACKTWLKESHPSLYNKLYPEQEVKGEGDQIDSTQGQKKKKGVKMGGNQENDGMIVVNRLNRGQHKTICQITGFQHYTKDLKAVAKMFAKKFSVGASVAQDDIYGECISVQGDVEERLLDLLEKDADFMKLKIPEDKVEFVDGGQKKGRKRH